MTCIICYDKVEENLFMNLELSKINSTLCLSCINDVITNQIDSYISRMNSETCSKAHINMITNGLPEYLTNDGSTFGKIVKTFEYNRDIVSGQLQTSKSINEINEIKNEMNGIIKALKNED